ncbi:hypothetical protein scyTo_0020000, partial [Scyliorhinus torazame]|nr:hypothetical protein [Scyliorhinus torazame]
QYIPMPVLYGVFLYMGVASLRGVQFMDRLKLLLMPPKHQPDFIYLRHVPLRRVHLFTFIQAICLAMLWILKSTVAAIIFPVMSDYPYSEKVPAINISMDLMEQEPFLSREKPPMFLERHTSC